MASWKDWAGNDYEGNRDGPAIPLDRTLMTEAPNSMPGHADNGNGPINRNTLADTDRLGESTRIERGAATITTNLINSDSIAGTDYGINAPIGGTPDTASSAGKPC